MKRISSIALLLVAGGCSDKDATERLTHGRWSSSITACAGNYLTFDKGRIAAHPDGQSLPLWDIRSMRRTSWWRPSDIAVQVEPSANLMPRIEASGKYQPGLRLNLRVEHDKVSILSASLGSETRPVGPGDRISMFNLVACP